MSARSHKLLRMLALPASLLLLSAGCGGKQIEKQEPEVDLSQSMDIFQRPVPTAQQLSPTAIVATVNGKDITAQQFQNEVVAMINRVRTRVPPEQLAQLQPRLREQALDSLIAKALLAEAAAEQQVAASPEEIAEARTKIEASLPQGFTIDDVLQQRNVSNEQFEKELGEELRINKLLEQRAESVGEITDAELQAYYEENGERFQQPELVTARHILIATDPQDAEDAKAEKKAKAEQVRERLLAGEDFAAVAAAETDDPGSRETGGLYGPFPRGQMVPQFDEAAFTQPEGEIGPLVETRFGYHIIKVEKHEQPRAVPLDEVKTNLAAFLRSRKMQGVAQEYIDELRSKAQVTIHQGE